MGFTAVTTLDSSAAFFSFAGSAFSSMGESSRFSSTSSHIREMALRSSAGPPAHRAS